MHFKQVDMCRHLKLAVVKLQFSKPSKQVHFVSYKCAGTYLMVYFQVERVELTYLCMFIRVTFSSMFLEWLETAFQCNSCEELGAVSAIGGNSQLENTLQRFSTCTTNL